MQRSEGVRAPVRNITTSSVCGLALGAIATFSSLPADAHEPSGSNWNGAYVGLTLGGAWGDAGFAVPSNPPGSVDLDAVAVGGFHAGLKRQWGNFVGGIETSFLFGDLGGTIICPNNTFTCSTDVNWIWMIGPKLGIARNNLHVYGTGGYALGRMTTTVVEIATGDIDERGHGLNSGWYLGGGVEWAFASSMVFGIEYKRIELGDDRHFSPTGVFAASRVVDGSIDTVQARLTFKLGEPHRSSAK